MNTTPSSPSSLPSTSRALVLGGGGSVGNAWEIGVVAGLAEAGLDVTGADLIVGTSAGATVAAQITGARPADLLDAVLSAPPHPRADPGRTERGRFPQLPVRDILGLTTEIIAASASATDMRHRMGVAALEADKASDGSWPSQWRATVEGRLPGQDWPDQSIRITAVDARSGEPVVFDRDSGVDLVDTVAASCSVGFPPYRLGEHRYIDGGYRRNENADLAAGYGRVLVVSPFGGRSRHPQEWLMDLHAQIEELAAGGSRVEAIFPDEASLAAFGPNMMDLSRRPPAARAGADQGRARAGQLAAFWR